MEIEYARPYLTNYQRAIIDSPARFTVTEASTKVGKTASHIVWLFEQALQGGDGNEYWWVAPVFVQTKIAFKRLCRQVKSSAAHQWNFFKQNKSELTLTLPNGAVLVFKSADNPDSLYGEDVQAAVFDEFTRAKEEAWFALRSTLTATRGKCKFIGNVRGRDWGYKLAQRAKNGADPDYQYFKITAWDAVAAGILSRREVLQAKRDLPKHVFDQLYLAEPVDDGSNPFGYNFLQAAERAGLSGGSLASLGIDLARKVDWTAIVGLDSNGGTCRLDRFRKDWGQTKDTIRALPDVPTTIDSTGVGDPILEDVQKGRRNTQGYKFTQISKQQLIEGLAAGLQRGEVTFPKDTPLADELYSFEYVHTRTGIRYAAPEGLHDDCVMALALAYHQFRHQPPKPTARAKRVRVKSATNW
ncbi:hypothetical protein DYU11_22655 [Fibrisoma montanum]|uniref:Uncharacterized protein n=1 Tax=Fibrisoma montanum TaxID=2305895 RepID=A0A418M1W0_9BACT|nr:terminase family protein [Fibrisoma montanum]RIV19733.1 hypothetical protein DYU11_22655 [Fibrisoma montanum]